MRLLDKTRTAPRDLVAARYRRIPFVVGLWLAGCGDASAEVGLDGGLKLPDAAVYVDAALPDAAGSLEFAGCSPTSGEVVTMIEGEFGGVGFGPTRVYVSRREHDGVYWRGHVYAAPKAGGPAVHLVDRVGSSAPREIKSDGERIYYRQSDWREVELNGSPGSFLEGRTPEELEIVDGVVYLLDQAGTDTGLWRRPASGLTPWELVAQGRFHGPLDVVGGFAVTGGTNPDFFIDHEYVYRIDLSDGSVETWGWGRDQIHELAIDGDGVYWIEGPSKNNHRLIKPLIMPTPLLPTAVGGVSNLEVSPGHVDYAYEFQDVGYIARYDRTTTDVEVLLNTPYVIRKFLSVGGYHFVMRHGIFTAFESSPGALFRYDSSNLAATPLEIAVPTFEPYGLVIDGEYVYWTDEGELLHPGSVWRTRISDGVTNEMLSTAWPRGVVLVDRILYFANYYGVWSLDVDTQDLVQVQAAENVWIVATDGEYIYWPVPDPRVVYRYLPGAAAPELVLANVNAAGLVVDDEFLYWIDRTQPSGPMVGRGRKDGSQPAERLIPHLHGVVGLFVMDDQLIYSHDSRQAFMSLPKSGPGMPPRLTPTLTALRTIGDEQFAVSFDGLVQRTPVTGELTPIWDGGGSNVKGYAVDDEHIFVLTPDRVLCITR